jgi:hypothetical protein
MVAVNCKSPSGIREDCMTDDVKKDGDRPTAQIELSVELSDGTTGTTQLQSLGNSQLTP